VQGAAEYHGFVVPVVVAVSIQMLNQFTWFSEDVEGKGVIIEVWEGGISLIKTVWKLPIPATETDEFGSGHKVLPGRHTSMVNWMSIIPRRRLTSLWKVLQNVEYFY
jgi:hypothetical protein